MTLRDRYSDPSTGRFNRPDPYAGSLESPLSLHKYAFGHGDPVNNVDPRGLWSLSNVLSALGIRGTTRGAKVIAVYNAYDKFSTFDDVVRMIGSFVLTGAVDAIQAAFLAAELIPFGGKAFRALKSQVTDLTRYGAKVHKVTEGTAILQKTFDAHGKIRKLSKVRARAQEIGEVGAGFAAKAAGMKPTKFIPRTTGIDQIYKKNGNLILVEAKGGTSGLGRATGATGARTQQMSQNWIEQKIIELRRIGQKDWANEIKRHKDAGTLQGMVVTTKINRGIVQDPEYVLKNFDDIGFDTFN